MRDFKNIFIRRQEHYLTQRCSLTGRLCSDPLVFRYVDTLYCQYHGNQLPTLVKLTKVGSCLPFSDWFWIKRNSVWFNVCPGVHVIMFRLVNRCLGLDSLCIGRNRICLVELNQILIVVPLFWLNWNQAEHIFDTNPIGEMWLHWRSSFYFRTN